MTLKEFKATKKESKDRNQLIYCDNLVIDVDGNLYFLDIENHGYASRDLSELELKLYKWFTNQ